MLCVGLALAGDLVLENARVVDADGVREVEALVVRGDRIHSVGVLPDDLTDPRRIDLQGATVVPGLIDAHVHLSLTPSGAHLGLTAAEERVLWAHHLRAYVASGVTTVLDTGIPVQAAIEMNALAAMGPSPSIHYLGPLVSPEGGYVNVVLPVFEGASTAEQVRAQVQAFAPLNPIGIKVTVERGMISRVWPLYTDEVVEALQEESLARGLPLYAHAIGASEVSLALDLGLGGLVHPPAKAKKKLVRRIVEDGIPVVTTLSTFDTLLIGIEPERLDDPLVVLTVPEIERDAARDPVVLEAYSKAIVEAIMPRSPGFIQRMVRGKLQQRGVLEGQLDKQGRSVLRLYEAGVPLVLGSDSGNWPIFPFEFHGPTTLGEMAALQRAGLPPEAVLEAATSNAAEMLGVADEVGWIRPGMRADLVVVHGDPLTDVGVLRDAEWVIRAGEIRSPAGWMSSMALGPSAPQNSRP